MASGRTPGGEAQYKHRNKKLQLIRDYKAARGCENCGEKDWIVLELHHLDPATKHPKLTRKTVKYRGSGGGFWASLSYKDLAEELEKCSVLCANCHRRETYKKFQEKGTEK